MAVNNKDNVRSMMGDAIDPRTTDGGVLSVSDVEGAARLEFEGAQSPLQIRQDIPVEDEMTADLGAIFHSENSGYSLFNEDLEEFRTAMYSDSSSKRLKFLFGSADNKPMSESLYNDLELLSQAEETAKRSEISMQESGDFVNSLVNRLASGEIDENLAAEALNTYQNRDKEYTQYMAEVKAANNLAEFAKNNPDWAEFSLENSDLYDINLETLTRDMMIRSFVDRQVAENNSVSWWQDIGEFYDDSKELIASIMGDEVFTTLADVVGGGKANDLRTRAEYIRDLPVDKVPAALEEFKNYLLDASSVYVEDNETAMDNLQVSFGTDWERNNSAGLDGFDAALTLLTLGGATGSASIKNTLKRTGNSDKVAVDATTVLKTNDTGDTVYDTIEDAVEDTLPVKVGNGEGAYLHHMVQDNLKEIDNALEEAAKVPTTQRLGDDELEEAVRRTVSDLRLNNEVVNIGIDYNRTNGVYEANLLIGKVSGMGYKSRKIAANALAKTGLDGEIVETQLGFKARVVMPVKEAFSDNGFVDFKPTHPVKAFFQGPKAFVDTFIGKSGTSSSFNEGRSVGILKDIYNKNFSKLSYKDKSTLSEIFDEGLVEEKWYTSDELSTMYRKNTGKELPAKVEQAYHALVKVSDYTWFVQNRALYQDKVAKGLNSIKLDMLDEPINGKMFSDAADVRRNITNHNIYDPESGSVVKATPDVVDKMIKKGYMIVRPEDATWTQDAFGSPASFIASKRNSVKISQLDLDQLGYIKGGRRAYTSNFFVGQKRHIRGADGSMYLGTPKVMRTADTVGDANSFVDNLNESFRLLREYRKDIAAIKKSNKLTSAEKKELLTKHKNKLNDTLIDTTKRSYDDLIDMINKEKWDINTPVQVKRNREDFPEDPDTLEAIKLYDPDNNHTRFGAKRNNRLSARGEKLLDVNGDESVSLNFMSALRDSADQAVKFGAYNEFKISAVNRFATTFGKYVKDGEKMTPYEMITKGEPLESLAKSVDPKMRDVHRAFKAHQFYIKSILRVRTKWDEMVQNSMNSLAQRIEGRGELGKKIAVSIYGSGNPVEKIRSINYDFNLGMFNPAQYVMQAQSMFSALSLSPVHGTRAFMESVPLRYALIANDDEVTNHISRSIRNNVDIDEYTDIQKSAAQFKRLGLHDFGSNIAMMDSQSSIGITSNPFVDKAIRLREQGRMFFQEGERMGRLVAYGIAKRKYAEKIGSPNVYTEKADIWIREEADRLLLSPNADNNQMFTKGALSLPTQFWSYMGKMADVFLTGANGRYTPKERATLASGQTLFYGAGGLPFLEYVINNVETDSGEKMDPDTAKFIHNGILDGMVYVLSDGTMSTNISDAAGFAGWMEQMYQNVSENTLAHVLGGATGGNISSAVDRFTTTAMLNGLWTNPTPEAVTEASLAGLGSLISSIDKASQAYIAFNTGIWYDKFGRKMFNVSKGEAIASLLGAQPQNLSDVFDIAAGKKAAKDKYINDVTTTLQGLHSRYDRAETDDERAHVQELINTLSVMSSQSGYWGDVANRFLSFQRSESFLQSQLDRMILDAEANKAGVNLNFFSKEQREEYSEGR